MFSQMARVTSFRSLPALTHHKPTIRHGCKPIRPNVFGYVNFRFQSKWTTQLGSIRAVPRTAKPIAIGQRRQASTSGTIQPFIMPDIGEGINEVIIREWLVKTGDQVKEFDPICEVESDKATANISSRYEGTIDKVHYQVGDKAKVGLPLVDIKLAQAAIDVKQASASQSATEASPSTPAIHKISKDDLKQVLPMLPSVRRLASTKGVDLSKVIATGKHGRILKEDVLVFLEASSNGESREFNQAARRQDSSATSSPGESIVPLKTVQKAMYKTMTRSLSMPHFNYADEINMTRLVEAASRRKLNTNDKQQVSNLAFIIKMLSLALCEFPELNASIDASGENMIYKQSHNIGVAIDTKAGLVVPNIKNVQSLSIAQVNSELKRLRELGYNSKLSFDDLRSGTISLSNIGAIGGIFGVPVIVSPEILIGALGKIRRLPRFNNKGDLEAQHIVQVVWSADHRVVDGATVARFSNLFKLYLEDPEAAMLKLA